MEIWKRSTGPRFDFRQQVLNLGDTKAIVQQAAAQLAKPSERIVQGVLAQFGPKPKKPF